MATELACRFCGCTEDDACLVPTNHPSVPREIAAEIERAGEKVIPCCWISTDPPVCSAPACVDKFANHQHHNEVRR